MRVGYDVVAKFVLEQPESMVYVVLKTCGLVMPDPNSLRATNICPV
jgi:hypothetical protein